MMFVMFIVKYDSNEELNLENMMDPESFDPIQIKRALFNDIYQKALRVWVPFLNKRGYLDKLLPREPPTPFMLSLMQQMQAAAVAAAPPQQTETLAKEE